jgi:hypothetical protein
MVHLVGAIDAAARHVGQGVADARDLSSTRLDEPTPEEEAATLVPTNTTTHCDRQESWPDGAD